MKHEPIYVTKSAVPPHSEYAEEIKSIFNNHWLTNMGEKYNKLNFDLKKILNVDNISLFTNGHLALELTLQSFSHRFDWNRNRMVTDVGTAEVITTPFTFISTTHAIVRNGLKPVFADIDPGNCCISPETIEPLINERTVAILPVHVYGNLCDVDGIEKLAKKYNLKVIYDAAHAFGEKINGRGVGSYGDASMFSFHATKVFNTIEGGGICFSNDDEWLKSSLYTLKNFGIKDSDNITGIGSNAKMNEFQASMGICNLRYFRKNIKDRECIAKEYIYQLNGFNKNIEILNAQQSTPNYAYFPVKFLSIKVRDKVLSSLADDNIFARKYFYPLTNDVEAYALRGTNMRIWGSNGENNSNPTPIAKEISDTVLTLPIYPDLDIEDVRRICKIIKGAVNE